MEYAFCIDEEMWRKDETALTEHDAIQRAIEYADENDKPLIVGQEIMIGEASALSMKSLISADDIMDQMHERVYDEIGEWAEDYPDLTKDEIEELDKLIADFFEKHAPNNFWTVEKPITHVITQEELDKHEASHA